MQKIIITLILLLASPNIALANTGKSKKGHSVIHVIALYIPNRLFDILDIARLRLRVGPGVSVGARATKVAQVFIGTHLTVYAGLPGPRLRRLPRLPVGLESHNGVTVSVVDATADSGIGPNYSDSEFGAGLQAGIIGVDFGIDPVEILDLFTGIFTFDVRDDDF